MSSEQDKNEDAEAKKSEWSVVWIMLLVLLVILVGVVIWVWYQVYKNRRFNLQKCHVGKNPFIMPMDAQMVAYKKRSDISAAEFVPVEQYDFENVLTVGLDLEMLKTGDLILSRFIRGKAKTDEFETLQKMFGSDKVSKHWNDPSFMRRLRHWADKEAMHQYYTGKDAPTHVCMVGRIYPPANGKKMGTQNVEIWNICRDGREKILLSDYLQRYPCTMAHYWIVHLNRTAPEPVVNMVEEYAEKISPPQYWYASLGTSYLCRSRGISLASRSALFKALKMTHGPSVTSQMSEQMLGLESTREILDYVGKDDDDRLAPKIVTCSKKIDLDEYALVEQNMSDSNPTSGWSDWKGLDHGHYSCSGLIYAYLEAFGLVLNMSDAISLKRQDCGDGLQNVVAGNVEYIEMQNLLLYAQDAANLREWDARIHFDPTARMRIMAPQTIAPCDFVRADFQWSENVYIKYASRFYCINKNWE